MQEPCLWSKIHIIRALASAQSAHLVCHLCRWLGSAPAQSEASPTVVQVQSQTVLCLVLPGLSHEEIH